MSRLEIDRNDSMNLPVNVRFYSDSPGIHEDVTLQPGQTMASTPPLAWQARRAVIDPERKTFDPDRFDNSTEWPDLDFFPGDATTFRDDAWTIFWLPYAFRRPGESVSWAIQASLFRHLRDSTMISLEHSPSARRVAWSLRHQRPLPTFALLSQFLLSKDYSDRKLGEIALDRSPAISSLSWISAGLRLRHRQFDDGDLGHQTYSFVMAVRPSPVPRPCGFKISGETERAPRSFSEKFSYARNHGILETACSFPHSFDIGLRAFRGKLISDENPQGAEFRINDLREARVRVDERELVTARDLASINLDIFTPLPLPVPSDSIVLARQLRTRLFHDMSYSWDQDVTWRASGVGVLMPIGGEVMGAGSLALSRLSILAILHSRVGDKTEGKPSVIFDLAGEL